MFALRYLFLIVPACSGIFDYVYRVNEVYGSMEVMEKERLRREARRQKTSGTVTLSLLILSLQTDRPWQKVQTKISDCSTE